MATLDGLGDKKMFLWLGQIQTVLEYKLIYPQHPADTAQLPLNTCLPSLPPPWRERGSQSLPTNTTILQKAWKAFARFEHYGATVTGCTSHSPEGLHAGKIPLRILSKFALKWFCLAFNHRFKLSELYATSSPQISESQRKRELLDLAI